MSIVSLSLHRVWPSVSRAFSRPSPFRAVGSEELRQISGLTLWGRSSSTILLRHRHSSVLSSIPASMRSSRASVIRPNTSASKHGTAEPETIRCSDSTSTSSRLSSFPPASVVRPIVEYRAVVNYTHVYNSQYFHAASLSNEQPSITDEIPVRPKYRNRYLRISSYLSRL